MSQDTFNKIVTSSMLIFFMTMFALSWYTNKPIDLAAAATFLVPMVTHTTHIITNRKKPGKSEDES